MIVIATYNNPKILTDLLDSMVGTNNLDEKVLIVCTDPKQTEMIEFLKELPGKYDFEILTDVTPFAGYDTGAYIHAYKKYDDDYFVFLQDSITMKSPDWLNAFKANRVPNLITSWVVFPLGFDNMEQVEWVESKVPDLRFRPRFGIFGPMFQIEKKTLGKLDEKYKLTNYIPTNKIIEQQGMERCWAYLAAHTDIELTAIDGLFLDWNNKKYINKHFQKRD